MKPLVARPFRCAGVTVTTIALLCGTQFVALSDTTDLSGQSAPASKITYSDLTHETYTATGNLTASFVFPARNAISAVVATRVVVDTVSGAGIDLSINGESVPSTRIGRHTSSAKAGLAEFEFFGVVLKPGPNQLVATALGANGSRGEPVAETVFGPGTPAVLKARLQSDLVADGKSTAILDVSALDRWNNPALAGSQIKVAVLRGDVTFAGGIRALAVPTAMPSEPALSPSADRGAAGAVFQAQLDAGGHVGVPIVPGLTAGDVVLQISSGDLTATETFYVAPYLRKPFVNGLVSFGAGSVPVAVDGDGQYDSGGARKARAAIFATGQVGKRSLMTLAYESQNPLSPLSSLGPFVDDPNERPYQTFGDSSTRSDDFRSNTRFYARLDSGRTSAMWGRFEATTGDAAGVGAFRELLSGAKVELAGAGSRERLTAFTARNDVAYVSTSVPVTGLSALAAPLHPDIVVGSDYLNLASIDRRTGAIVAQTPLLRNLDYTIDYATGVLRFINVPLPFDENFNPQVLLVQYQYQGLGAHSQTTGGNLEADFGRTGSTKLKFGYVNDATGASNFSIYSQALSGRLAGGGWSLSHATSNGASPGVVGEANPLGTHGGAVAFLLNDRIGQNQLDVQYQETGSGYADPFGGISSPGFTNYRVAWSHHAANADTLTFEADGQRNRGFGVDDSQRNVNLLWHKTVTKRLALLLGAQAHAQQNAPAVQTVPETSTTTQAQLGFDWRAGKRLDLNVQRDQTLGGNDAQSTQPAQTSAQLSYAFDNKGKLFVRELLSAAPVTSFAESTGGLTVSNLGARSTQVGFERATSPATTIDTEYLITNTGSGSDIYSALGVQQKFAFGNRLGGNLLVQQANASGAGASAFTVYGASLAYTGTKDFRAGLSYQSRSGLGGGSTLSGGFTGHMGPNTAVLGTVNQASGSGTKAADDAITLAFRPAENDRLVSLLGYQLHTGTESFLADRSNVLSFEELFRPWDGFELAGRFATKLDGDGYYAAHTSLFGVRGRQNVGSRFDVGAEIRLLEAVHIPGARATDFAVEAGYQLGSSARIAAGYNFSGSVDPTLTGHPQRKGLYVTFATLVDRIFGWGARR
ncbi:MAG: hypothetical protein ACXVAF_05215 [Vulcanimicrobiaceae bacterium]